ncbi:MAG: tRNA pseudouridine(55) synthase TruB [Gammaproteobacteria bacterium]
MTVSGALPIDKEAGCSSARAVADARGLFGGVKAGHAGTLDPAATGVLTVMLGEATGFLRFLPRDKTYRAEIVFGAATDTDDACGEIIFRGTPPRDLRSAVREVLPHFVGEYEQTAPAYSALKHAGRPMHYYARNGISAPAKRRKVEARELRIESAEGERATLHVRCGGGFYVRALARDIGESLRCGAHLAALRRTRCAPFDSAAPLREVAAASPEERSPKYVASLAATLSHLPRRDLDGDAARALGGGREINGTDGIDGSEERVRFFCEGRFAGVGAVSGGRARGEKMLSWTREAR